MNINLQTLFSGLGCFIKTGIDALNQQSLTLSHILLTHHHYDYSGGVKELKKLYPKAKVAIHQADAGRLAKAYDVTLSEGDIIDFGTVPIKILHLPCRKRRKSTAVMTTQLRIWNTPIRLTPPIPC